MQKIIQLNSPAVGHGKERICYVHPEDPGKAIKLQLGEVNKQTLRELQFYDVYCKQEGASFFNVPEYYGPITTSKGKGFVVDLVRDFNGEISKPLYWYISHGYQLEAFDEFFEQLYRFLLAEQVVFCNDMSKGNVLFKIESEATAKFVVIDGLGDHAHFKIANQISWVARKKIRRRWQRFMLKTRLWAEQASAEAKSAGMVDQVIKYRCVPYVHNR